MYDFFYQKLLYRRFFMMDGTPVQVLNENDKRFLNGIAPGFYLMADGCRATTKTRKQTSAVVGRISADIFWDPYQREWIRIILILQSRVFSIVKSCSHMNVPIKKKGLAISKSRPQRQKNGY